MRVRLSLKSATHRSARRASTLKEDRLGESVVRVDHLIEDIDLRGVALAVPEVSRLDHDHSRDDLQTAIDPAFADCLHDSSGLTSRMPMQSFR